MITIMRMMMMAATSALEQTLTYTNPSGGVGLLLGLIPCFGGVLDLDLDLDRDLDLEEDLDLREMGESNYQKGSILVMLLTDLAKHFVWFVLRKRFV